MSLEAAAQVLVGDYSAYADMGDRIEGLVAKQVEAFVPHRSNWLILPWQPPTGPAGFYLFSEDREGQRRGREVISGFLGPNVARLVSSPDDQIEALLPKAWAETGLTKTSLIHRTQHATRADMLTRLEDLVATIAGRPATIEEAHPTHVDLLRDVRLAMLSRDAQAAQRLFDQLVLTGHLSAENLRFLTIELHACFGRWQEMANLPYISVLMQARRPRMVTESMLQMIWWTQIVSHLGLSSVASAFASQNVLSRYGSILRSIEVPSTPEGRILAYLTALADEDSKRQHAIRRAVSSPDEEAGLATLTAPLPVPPPGESEPMPEFAAVRAAFDSGRLKHVVDLFLTQPSPADADFAVQAILDLDGHVDAAKVLTIVREWVADGRLNPGRRLASDITALDHLVSGVTAGWVEWAGRIGAINAWEDAASTLRNQHAGWAPLGSLPAGQVLMVAEGVLGAIGSTNEQQLRASLDVLCRVAAEVVDYPSCAPFTDMVLEFLAIQDNVSAQVRDAYVTLFEAILEAGPSAPTYDAVLTRTTELWERIKARQHVDWALEILDATAGASSPAQGRRDAFGVAVIGYLRSLDRLDLRQRVEIESLATEYGLIALGLEDAASAADTPVWSKLDGTVVGLYSLLSQAVPRFSNRLFALCTPKEIVGNTDTTATRALIHLAERADHLVVDTWHAAHQATDAIDDVRPRSRQVMPQQRGVTGFLRALENSLEA
ncbi:protein DpdD [Kribbella lupini]|uniref:Uncharacterized protein n=1 Tax=Kribbella lupini TaxID=291602 RepID=A0ABN2BTL6_9ACTN